MQLLSDFERGKKEKEEDGPFFYILWAFAERNKKGVTVAEMDCHYYCVVTLPTEEIILFDPREKGQSSIQSWPFVIKKLLSKQKTKPKFAIYGTQTTDSNCGQHVIDFINTWDTNKDSYVKHKITSFK